MVGRLPAWGGGRRRWDTMPVTSVAVCAMRSDGHLAELPQLVAYGRKWMTDALGAWEEEAD